MTLQDDIGLGSLTWEGYDVKLTLFAIPGSPIALLLYLRES